MGEIAHPWAFARGFAGTEEVASLAAREGEAAGLEATFAVEWRGIGEAEATDDRGGDRREGEAAIDRRHCHRSHTRR